jgi:hypothetical protein
VPWFVASRCGSDGVAALVAPFVVTSVAVVKRWPLMTSATQVANDFLDDARGERSVDELLCAPARPTSGSTTDRMTWTTEQPEERFRPPRAPDEVVESSGSDAVSVRLRHVDDRWCVRDVWLGVSHREAIPRP